MSVIIRTLTTLSIIVGSWFGGCKTYSEEQDFDIVNNALSSITIDLHNENKSLPISFTELTGLDYKKMYHDYQNDYNRLSDVDRDRYCITLLGEKLYKEQIATNPNLLMVKCFLATIDNLLKEALYIYDAERRIGHLNMIMGIQIEKNDNIIYNNNLIRKEILFWRKMLTIKRNDPKVHIDDKLLQTEESSYKSEMINKIIDSQFGLINTWDFWNGNFCEAKIDSISAIVSFQLAFRCELDKKHKLYNYLKEDESIRSAKYIKTTVVDGGFGGTIDFDLLNRTCYGARYSGAIFGNSEYVANTTELVSRLAKLGVVVTQQVISGKTVNGINAVNNVFIPAGDVNKAVVHRPIQLLEPIENTNENMERELMAKFLVECLFGNFDSAIEYKIKGKPRKISIGRPEYFARIFTQPNCVYAPSISGSFKNVITNYNGNQFYYLLLSIRVAKNILLLKIINDKDRLIEVESLTRLVTQTTESFGLNDEEVKMILTTVKRILCE